MHKSIFTLLLLVALSSAQAVAKSLVITLADAHATRVYYKLGGDVAPRLVLADDGTFTLNDRTYTFLGVKNFFISTTDYAGERYTEDAIIALDDEGRGTLRGAVRVYALDGRLVRETDGGFTLQGLPAGTYVVTNGTQPLKLQKR